TPPVAVCATATSNRQLISSTPRTHRVNDRPIVAQGSSSAAIGTQPHEFDLITALELVSPARSVHTARHLSPAIKVNSSFDLPSPAALKISRDGSPESPLSCSSSHSSYSYGYTTSDSCSSVPEWALATRTAQEPTSPISPSSGSLTPSSRDLSPLTRERSATARGPDLKDHPGALYYSNECINEEAGGGLTPDCKKNDSLRIYSPSWFYETAREKSPDARDLSVTARDATSPMRTARGDHVNAHAPSPPSNSHVVTALGSPRVDTARESNAPRVVVQARQENGKIQLDMSLSFAASSGARAMRIRGELAPQLRPRSVALNGQQIW
ncbi:hypothetical protein PFISCL1PPCAC_23863, partial [Pristionchus fissidentatus]